MSLVIFGISCIVLVLVAVVMKQLQTATQSENGGDYINASYLTQGELPWVSAPHKTTLVAPLKQGFIVNTIINALHLD
jgi:hypothetical protein